MTAVMDGQVAGRAETPHNQPLVRVVFISPTTRILVAVVLLFAASPILAPGSVDHIAVSSMLPFAAITTIVALGQTLTIQQGGLDLSVGAAISLGAVLAARYGSDPEMGVTFAIVLAVGIVSLFGVLSGLVIAVFGLPPIVVTIATSLLMVGAVQQVSGGAAVKGSAELSSFALRQLGGIPVLAIIAIAITLVGQMILKVTRAGRRFELVGENATSAQIIGISSRRHIISAYWLSALLAGFAGVLLAGLLRSPTAGVGDNYLLPSVAAVVLGGTALTGGRGYLAGTALAALFLGQLNQLVQTFTQTSAVQNLIQALIIGACIIAQMELGELIARVRGRCRLPRIQKIVLGVKGESE
ncbi:ABC transporter permease [Nocardioides immobilis]|uniref:ABC transporter permease n=2 Tax=Nocardioides immobilis TaxID=2049295 RepID=A0A417Y758_9ACTN|nr:ABC transporter permease [Nocardioides immobilis]